MIEDRYDPNLVFTITIAPKDSFGQHFVSEKRISHEGELLSGSGWPYTVEEVDRLIAGLKKDLVKQK